jgi:hypothetical protein
MIGFDTLVYVLGMSLLGTTRAAAVPLALYLSRDSQCACACACTCECVFASESGVHTAHEKTHTHLGGSLRSMNNTNEAVQPRDV